MNIPTENPLLPPVPAPRRSPLWFLAVALLIALPAIVDLVGVPLATSKSWASSIAPVMLLLSLPLSLGAGIMVAFMMRRRGALLLLWIPLFSVLALAASYGLQAGSCSISNPRIDFR